MLGTKDEVPTLSANDRQILHWNIGAAFGVHSDMKSHAGIKLSMGFGKMSSSSIKQKLNSRSSTKEWLIDVDDKKRKFMWCNRFMEAQGFKVILKIIFQDNTCTIRLVGNGK